MSKNAIVSIEVRVILVQWPCNCVPAMECSHQSFTLLLSLGCFKSPKLLSQFSHRAVAAALCVAGVALGDICLHFAWQAWHLATSTSTLAGVALGDICLHFALHLATSTSTLHGRCDNYGIWWHAWFPVEVVVAAAVSVAGVALGDICLHFAWQAWRLATWTSALRGRRGTWRHRRAFCVAGVALMALGWLWWRAWFPLDAVVAAAVCVAGVALGDIDLHFAWQAWHLATFDVHSAWQPWCLVTSTLTLRGRCGHAFLVTHNFVTQNSSTTLSQIPFTHNFVTQAFHTQLCHTQLSHTHNFVTHNSFTQHSFTHNLVTYISFTHNLLHTTLSHTTLSHTIFYITNLHTQHCRTQLFHPTCLASSPFLPAFPISFSHLLFGDHWKKLISGVIPSFNLRSLADLLRFGRVNFHS